MRSVRVATAVLLVAVAALIGALVVGASQARDNAAKKDLAAAEQELTASFWPPGFKRVSAADPTCAASAPSVCLYTPQSSKDAASDLVTRLSAPSFGETPMPGGPNSYVIEGSLTRGGTPVIATVVPHLDEKATKASKKATFTGSDVVVSLKRGSSD